MVYTIDDVTLRATPAGSLAAVLLQQSAAPFALATWPGLAWYSEYLVPSLGGTSNVWTFFLPLEIDNGSFMLWNTSYAAPALAQGTAASNLPDQLRRESGLPIEALAKAVGVSKVTYHKWLNGAGISEESDERLHDLRDLLGAVAGMKPALRIFLHSLTPAGTPLELLSQKKDALVLGLAARGDVAFAEQAAPAGGLRRVRRTGWADSVDHDRLEDAYPSAMLEEGAIATCEESEPVTFACVLFQR